MLTNFAAGTLIVLGVLFAVLGVFAGNGNVPFTLIGLGSVAVGGILGAFGRRAAA
jgi:1,4-dihydroxy-2-naphthoate octaprenyltransferase